MSYLFAEEQRDVPEDVVQRLEAEAALHWDRFYARNADRFYKDRHYLDREFPELCSGPATVVEVGCGAGNTVYPLLEVNPQLRVYCCDFSPKAVQLVQAHPGYSSGHVTAFVADLTRDDLCPTVPRGCADFVTMVFVLSAVAPHKMASAVANAAQVLKLGGRLLFRDYEEGDLAQYKREGSGARRLGERFFLRGDGTRCYHFSPPELSALFSGAGFECVDVHTHSRQVENRKKGITMSRRWLQAVFKLTRPPPPFVPVADVQQQDASNMEEDPAAGVGAGLTTAGQQYQDGGVLWPPLQAPAPGNQHGSRHSAASPAAPTRGQVPPLSPPPALLTSTWLTGAAGRLAAHSSAPPGVPSGRALLPETLDPADEVALTLSPGARARPTAADRATYDSSDHHSFGDDGMGVNSSPDVTSGATRSRAAQHQHLGTGQGATPGQGQGSKRTLSGGGGGVSGGVRRSVESLEAHVEREFFETVGRDAREVAEEEAAAAGLAAISLADPFEGLGTPAPQAAQHNISTAQSNVSSTVQGALHTLPASASPSQQHDNPTAQQQQGYQPPVQVEVAPGCSFLVPSAAAAATLGPGYPVAAPPHFAPHSAWLELGLARLLATCPLLKELVQGSCVLQLATGPGAVAAMTAVRACGARRTLATHAERATLTSLASSLAANAPRLVVERLKVAQLVWGHGPSVRNVLTLGSAHGGYPVILCSDLGAAVQAELKSQEGRESSAHTATPHGGLQHWQLPAAQPGLVHTSPQQASSAAVGWGPALRVLLEGARLAAVGHVPASLVPSPVHHHHPPPDPMCTGSAGHHQGQPKVLITQLPSERSAEVAAVAQSEGWHLHAGLSAAAQSTIANMQGSLQGSGIMPAMFVLET